LPKKEKQVKQVDLQYFEGVESICTWCANISICSAKTRDGVQEAFEELVHKVLQTPSLYVSSEAKDSVRVGGDSGQQDSWCGGSCTVTWSLSV